MPIKTDIDKSRDLTTFTVTGVLTFDEVMPVVEAFHTGDPTEYALWDLLEITDVHFTSEQVVTIAGYQQPVQEGKRATGKIAIVAPEDHLYGLSRMLETHNELMEASYTIGAFRSKTDAYKWLDET